jgi:type IV secretion system protein VirD4
MLDEFPALGRLDFFETALAFMAGYGIRAYLIAQSLNQISKAYGENNSILDNCHVRIAFSSNDERTAKRISDALGTTTEQRAQRNYAGHRLSPWLAHVMVSRQETARPLLTPGEVMQLPASDELVLVSGLAPIRAQKLHYYRDQNFTSRVVAPPALYTAYYEDKPKHRSDDWSGQICEVHPRLLEVADSVTTGPAVSDDGGQQKQRAPELDGKAFGSILKSNADVPDKEPSNSQSDAIRSAYAMNNTKRHTAPEQEMLPYFGDHQ